MRTRKSSFVVLCCLVALFACASDRVPPEVDEIPPPHGLADLDPPVQKSYNARRDALAAALRDNVSAGKLAEAYGAFGMWHSVYAFSDGAVACYERAEALAPLEARWPYYRAQILADAGDLDGAVAVYDQVIALAPRYVPALIRRAEIELSRDRPSAARPFLSAALEIEPNSARAIVHLAGLDLENGDAERAIAGFERAMKIQPGVTRVHYGLGLAYRKLGDREKAERHMREAMVDNRDKSDVGMNDPWNTALSELREDANLYSTQGRNAFHAGNTDAAIAAAQQAVAAAPGKPLAHLNLGAAYLQAKRYEEAIAAFAKALDLEPGHGIAHFNSGAAYAEMGRIDDAIHHYREALRANAGYKEPLYNLANLLRRQGKCDEAIELYDRMIVVMPTHGQTRLWRAVCLVQLHRYADAVAKLNQDIQSFPDSVALVMLRTRLLVAAPEKGVRDGIAALADAQRLYHARPSVSAAELVAMAYAEQGNFDSAIQWQRAALIALRGRSETAPLRRRARRRIDGYKEGKPWRIVIESGEPLQIPIQAKPPAAAAG